MQWRRKCKILGSFTDVLEDLHMFKWVYSIFLDPLIDMLEEGDQKAKGTGGWLILGCEHLRLHEEMKS